ASTAVVPSAIKPGRPADRYDTGPAEVRVPVGRILAIEPPPYRNSAAPLGDRQSERALIERVIGSVFAFDRKLRNAARGGSKKERLMMSGRLRALAEKPGEHDLAVVAHLRAAEAQDCDLVPFIGFVARLRHAGELSVRIKEQPIAAVRH